MQNFILVVICLSVLVQICYSVYTKRKTLQKSGIVGDSAQYIRTISPPMENPLIGFVLPKLPFHRHLRYKRGKKGKMKVY